MKNLSTLTWSLILIGSMTMSGCLSNLEQYELRYASKMQAFNEDTSSGAKTGGIRMIPISTQQGTFKVWTKTIGNSEHIKVLLLGSGPGLSHEYLQCMESYFPGKAISFIYYDPLGSGRSENLKDTTWWNPSSYTEQVEQLRSALNLNQNNFYLFGHGRGGILCHPVSTRLQLKAFLTSRMILRAPSIARLMPSQPQQNHQTGTGVQT